ncbi:hypothetical protein GCM10008921_21690 [Metaclostridioides mangenotii]
MTLNENYYFLMDALDKFNSNYFKFIIILLLLMLFIYNYIIIDKAKDEFKKILRRQLFMLFVNIIVISGFIHIIYILFDIKIFYYIYRNKLCFLLFTFILIRRLFILYNTYRSANISLAMDLADENSKGDINKNKKQYSCLLRWLDTDLYMANIQFDILKSLTPISLIPVLFGFIFKNENNKDPININWSMYTVFIFAMFFIYIFFYIKVYYDLKRIKREKDNVVDRFSIVVEDDDSITKIDRILNNK